MTNLRLEKREEEKKESREKESDEIKMKNKSDQNLRESSKHISSISKDQNQQFNQNQSQSNFIFTFFHPHSFHLWCPHIKRVMQDYFEFQVDQEVLPPFLIHQFLVVFRRLIVHYLS